MSEKMRVALGMSGGVDSSVAVAVLQHHGYDVLGVTCLFQHDAAARDAVAAAREVCERFGIEHVAHDCAQRFEECVVDAFVRDYASGLTPSPCVGCNRTVKVPELMRVADEYGCELVATGHYARVNRLQDTGRFAILTALDHRKDQSYMLGMLAQEQLVRLVLPLGGMTKLEVRAFAAELGLSVADAPESQDTCFAAQGYRALLAARGVVQTPGPIVRRDGEVVGRHSGLADYTVGQRKGIGVAGPEPYYVLEKRVGANELVIGTAEESRIGWADVAQMVWQAIEEPTQPVEAMVKLRYRSTPCPCIIEPKAGGRAHVRLRSSQQATAPGQYAVIYQGSLVVGAGLIEEVGA